MNLRVIMIRPIMKYQLLINSTNKQSKTDQIVEAIVRDIETGLLEKNTRLPSISDFSLTHAVARDTVEKAYNRLKIDGYLISVPGKGNFIAPGKEKDLKILMILNKLSSYKKDVYYAFLKALGPTARVDLQLHHYNPELLDEILAQNKDKYHYYVIMPHFFDDANQAEYIQTLLKVPQHSLVLLDKDLQVGWDTYMSVYQDFRQDIYDALQSAKDLLDKYNSVLLVSTSLAYKPREIISGIQAYCEENGKTFDVVADVTQVKLEKGQAFITMADAELAELFKRVKYTDLTLGLDLGIVSFNETILKELLGITVVTTDFDAMGKVAGNLILQRDFRRIRNEFRLIKRQSL